jgi:hypothetical protein
MGIHMNRKYHVVAFVGGAGINVAKTFLKLKEQLCKSESPSVKTLVIGDLTCSANSSTLPTSDYQFMLSAELVAVGTAVTCRPPHRSVLAVLPHTAPASGSDLKPL